MATLSANLKSSQAATTSWFGRRGASAQRSYAQIQQNLWVAAGTLIAIAASTLTLTFHPVAGVVVNAAVLAFLIGLALWREPVRKLATSVAILPVVTLLSLSLPATNAFAESAVIYASLLLLTLVYRYIFTLDQPLTFSRLTLRGYGLALPLMVVLGQVLGVLAYGLQRHSYSFSATPTALVALAAVVFAAAEEMFFRGLVQQQAAKVMHPVIAAILSAGLYTIVSINHATILAPLFGLITGAVLAATYYKKQNLILTTTINAAAKLTYIGLLAAFVLR